MLYDYKQGKKDVEEILNSKTQISNTDSIPGDERFTYDNGVRAWVGSIFVDIVDSTSLFKSQNLSPDMISRIIRSFVEQIVIIMNNNENVYQIGIRGDCVYGVFQANRKEKMVDMFRTAYCINSFLNMFSIILKKHNLPPLKAGIGLGSNKDIVIKAGKKKITNDKIWVGDAVVNASNLSKIANRLYVGPICLDETTYINIIELLSQENHNYQKWISKGYSSKYKGTFYECNIIQIDFDEWINKELI